MRIEYLELRNYRKFKDLKLQFPDGIVGILGLNGSGKTTIIEAVAWALFGNEEEVVRTNRESIRFSNSGPHDTVKAVLEFELDDKEYRVNREMGGRSLSMKASLHSGGEVIAEGDKAVRAAVQRLIGMDYKAFFTSVFARQKELDDLQEMQPARRKETVLRMLRIDGLDAIIRSIRADKNSASERIRGAEALLFDEDGNDRESAAADRLGLSIKEAADAEKDLEMAKEAADTLLGRVAEARKRRDALRKDVEALNVTSARLEAIRRSLNDKRVADEASGKRILELEHALDKLPELEHAEGEWNKASIEKDTMEREKERFDKREHLRRDIETIDAETKALAERITGLGMLRHDEEDAKANIESASRDLKESASQRERLAKKIAASNARIAEWREGLDRHANQLAEIKDAGERGTCPTCERPLGESYSMLVDKIEGDIASAKSQIEEEEGLLSSARSNLSSLENRVVALEKKLEYQEKRMAKLRSDSAKKESFEDELRRTKVKREDRMRVINEMGDIPYSSERHEAARKTVEEFNTRHEEFLKLDDKRNQFKRAKSERDELRASVKLLEKEEMDTSTMVEKLSPRKALYEGVLEEYDNRNEEFVTAKDQVGNAKAVRERAKGDCEAAKRELRAIQKSKETVEQHRKRVDELGALEEVFVNFKDHLISRIAPTLGDFTSGILDLMTDGKYDRVSLDDNYQMSVEDGGTFHPLDRFSGGEADIANLSLRLAISKVVAERTGTNQINFLILDEIFGSLDPSRKRSVMIALSGLSSQFRQVMLITHVDDIKDLLTNVISVEELPDGTSTAKIVS
ncbi:MAG: SMC family ATPase [Methanobacteriota archaeon]|nr:MAG: SMC family ATPase [Euryarchaeota archaeon]